MKNGRNSTIHYRDYVAGWLDSSISDFLAHFPRPSRTMDFALVTALDSDLSPAKLLAQSPQLESIAANATTLGDGFIVPTSAILTATKIFFGFDEVWFFPHRDIAPKPEGAWLVGPRRIDQPKLDTLGPWMAGNECSLALGDGDGLNLVVKARGFLKHLLGYSIHQREPTNGGEEESVADSLVDTLV